MSIGLLQFGTGNKNCRTALHSMERNDNKTDMMCLNERIVTQTALRKPDI